MRAPTVSHPIRWMHRIAVVVASLMVFASGVGLGLEGIYRDNPLVSAGWKGNDVVNLFLAAPLLMTVTWRSAGGGTKARVATLGMLLYAFYGYAFYLFGAAFNALFLVYVAIVTLSGIGLLLGLIDVEADWYGREARSMSEGKIVAAFMLAVGALLATFWIALSVNFLLTDQPPGMVAATGHPTNVTGALDLSLVVPLALVAGFGLWRRRPWGYVLALIWNVKGAVYMLALSAAGLSAYGAGATEDLGQLFVWVPIAVGCTGASVRLLQAGRARP